MGITVDIFDFVLLYLCFLLLHFVVKLDLCKLKFINSFKVIALCSCVLNQMEESNIVFIFTYAVFFTCAVYFFVWILVAV